MAKRYGRPVRRALCPLLVLLAFLSGLLLLPGQALASDRSYQITQVDIDATVDADGTLHVVETRTFDFDGSFNGVYWDIPTGYNPNNGQEVEVNVTSAGESTAGSLLAFSSRIPTRTAPTASLIAGPSSASRSIPPTATRRQGSPLPMTPRA